MGATRGTGAFLANGPLIFERARSITDTLAISTNANDKGFEIHLKVRSKLLSPLNFRIVFVVKFPEDVHGNVASTEARIIEIVISE